MKKIILLISFILCTFICYSQYNSAAQNKTLKHFTYKKRLYKGFKNSLSHKYVRPGKRGYIKDSKVIKSTKKILKRNIS